MYMVMTPTWYQANATPTLSSSAEAEKEQAPMHSVTHEVRQRRPSTPPRKQAPMHSVTDKANTSKTWAEERWSKRELEQPQTLPPHATGWTEQVWEEPPRKDRKTDGKQSAPQWYDNKQWRAKTYTKEECSWEDKQGGGGWSNSSWEDKKGKGDGWRQSHWDDQKDEGDGWRQSHWDDQKDEGDGWRWKDAKGEGHDRQDSSSSSWTRKRSRSTETEYPN